MLRIEDADGLLDLVDTGAVRGVDIEVDSCIRQVSEGPGGGLYDNTKRRGATATEGPEEVGVDLSVSGT
jgi:hypothetical protein